MLQDFLKMDESDQVALYFLFGDAEDGSEPSRVRRPDRRSQRPAHQPQPEEGLLAAGAGADLAHQQPHADPRRSSWSGTASRLRRRQGATPTRTATAAPSRTPRPRFEADCLEIFETGRTLLATLGYPVFEPVGIGSSPRTPRSVFTAKRPGIDGRGLYTPEGFVVLKGSIGRRSQRAVHRGHSKRALPGQARRCRRDAREGGQGRLRKGPPVQLAEHGGDRAARPHRPTAGRVEEPGRHDARPTKRSARRLSVSLHKEVSFEDEVCEHLAAHGWLYAEGDAAGYDRARALFPADVLAWVQATQPKAWESAARRTTAAQAAETLLDRLRDQLDQRGTLDVLRHGIELLGLKQPLKLAEFKPALAINADILARYAANRLRVVRQVRYSLHNENSIDLVLFLNGLPVATVELKTDFTQSIGDAVDQYRFDRNPRPKGQAPELLLSFPMGALVHFAVSNSEVCMVTTAGRPGHPVPALQSGQRRGRGQPGEPGGRAPHRVPVGAGLGARELARDPRALPHRAARQEEADRAGDLPPLSPARRHAQAPGRRARRRARAASTSIQHSAGSGKTNSIAWTAHFLAELHDARDKKVFDTVLVVSDRNVIDSQLQEALFDFERTAGVVATITDNDGSKSGSSRRRSPGTRRSSSAPSRRFPLALEAVRKLAATRGQALRGDRRRGPQLPDRGGRDEAQGRAHRRGVAELERRRRGQHRGHPGGADGGARRRRGHHLRGLHGDAEEQDDGALRHAAGPDPQAAPTTTSRRRFTSTRCGRRSRRSFILDVLKNYTPYSLALQARARGQGARRARGRAQRGAQEGHGLGEAAPLQHRAEGRRSSSSTSATYVAPLLDGPRQGDGGRREPPRGGALAARDREVHPRTAATRSAPLVAFSGEILDEESGPDPVHRAAARR